MRVISVMYQFNSMSAVVSVITTLRKQLKWKFFNFHFR